jgi:penicillin-binding protein 1C
VIKRRRWFFLAGLAFAGLAVGSLYLPYPKSKLAPGPGVSLRITDRNGLLLREVLSTEGGCCRWVGLDGMSPWLIRAFLASEDRDFPLHDGVRLPSVVRALAQNARRKRIVSGASTITQQVVRNIERRPRTLGSKLLEAWSAIRLEHTLTKGQILVQYLNRVPFGNRVFGAEAASRLYFEKPCAQLGPAEAAFLAGIPRSPSTTNPYRDTAAALRRQKDILAAMARLGFLSPPQYERAAGEDIRLLPEGDRFRAPHFCDFLLDGPGFAEGVGEVRTTLDYGLQHKAETLLREHVERLRDKGVSNGAFIVMDNATGDILAMAGSKAYFDDRAAGQVNGALSLRQPGSALKPFTYALALERGLTAASVIEDVPNVFPSVDGNYEPRNYDRKFHGPTRMRSALASSYNVPAVTVLESLGPDLLYRKLKALGFDGLRKPPGFYGLGLTLGNGEVTLLELVRAYAALARGGLFRRERTVLRRTDGVGGERPGIPGNETSRVFSPQAAYIITDILADRDARVPSFGYRSPLNLPFPCAAKTGTSKDYRDNWTVGYTPAVTIGVWVGNFDAAPMHDVSGISGCGPLFRDLMLLAANGSSRPFEPPPGIVRRWVCPLSGNLVGDACPGRMEEIFIAGTEPKAVCRAPHVTGAALASGPAKAEVPRSDEGRPFEVLFPRDGGIFKLDPVLRQEFQVLGLKARLDGSTGAEVEWWINGRRVGTASSAATFPWKLEPGFYTIKAVIRAGGRAIGSPPVRITVLS